MRSRDLFVNVLMLLCIVVLKETGVESAASANAFDADLKNELENVTIRCDVTGISTYKIVWKKDEKLLEGERYSRHDTTNSLTIIKAGRHDVGKYVCMFVPDAVTAGDGNVSATPYVNSGPFVDPFHTSVNPWKGDEVELHCKVYGHPMPDISWKKDETLLTNSTKTQFGAYAGVENAMLTIRELESSDRAYYHCVASDGKNETSQKILVRVKDRYAALWPFIGICIEVIVLILIIFIYEKRKTKSTDDDSDSGGKTNSHAQLSPSDGDVRQRNTVRT